MKTAIKNLVNLISVNRRKAMTELKNSPLPLCFQRNSISVETMYLTVCMMSIDSGRHIGNYDGDDGGYEDIENINRIQDF